MIFTFASSHGSFVISIAIVWITNNPMKCILSHISLSSSVYCCINNGPSRSFFFSLCIATGDGIWRTHDVAAIELVLRTVNWQRIRHSAIEPDLLPGHDAKNIQVDPFALWGRGDKAMSSSKIWYCARTSKGLIRCKLCHYASGDVMSWPLISVRLT